MEKHSRASRADVVVQRHNGRLTILITDDGVGGAAADPGSGLAGLADRVASLDGALAIQSPAGAGTIVTAELPLTGSDGATGTGERAIRPAGPGAATRILVVDDHDEFRAQARLLLDACGYDVVGESAGAADALAAYQRLHPDAVLLDVQLPDGDGFAVAARLADEPDAPIVVLISSREAADHGARLHGRGVHGFIHKPELSRGALQEHLGSTNP